MGSPQMESSPDQICAYAALILADGGVDVTADNIQKVAKAAGCTAPAYMAALFEKVDGMNSVKKIVKKASTVGSGAPAAGGAAPAAGGAAAAAPVEEEEEEEEDIPAAGGLFDDGDDY